MFPQLRKHLLEVWDNITGLFRLDHDIINIHLDDSTYEISEDVLHASLERGTCVFEPEGHRFEAVSTERSDE
jgi:hypothetical protein